MGGISHYTRWGRVHCVFRAPVHSDQVYRAGGGVHRPAKQEQARQDTLVDRLYQAALGTLDVMAVYIGDRMGYYRVLCDGPVTSVELARRSVIPAFVVLNGVLVLTGFMLIDTLLSDEKGSFLNALHHHILPTIVLGTIPLAVIARMTRSAMLEVLGEDYIRTARAKGLSSIRVVAVHALRNALVPVVTVIGLQVGTLMGGAILTESVFSWPGIGKWLVESIGRRDYPALQGGVLVIAALVMTVNLDVDLLYGLLNPRIRHRR